MARCQHCDKLIHDEHLYVYFDVSDSAKIDELLSLSACTPAYMYNPKKTRELCKLATQADIVIHFIACTPEEIKNLK